ncbi:FxsA family protein [Nocardioides sp. Y6]|uniref:FxsA family protein n=1 Tax=Nocardioides malaquae TaxID=2773426 RepID=A0ABR9RSB2_9ACTN|nr:FxsA family protein [Nocardioides malaquae]MBE7324472.1 FxsA family protein [Nocardioides malaquae]
MTPRRRFPRWLLVLLLVVMPLLELYVLVQVGQVIGAWWTILLLVVASVIGGWLIRREGGRAWRALTEAVSAGRVPTRELADGALVVVAGALMLSPGFVTDAFALFLILPLTRPIARRALTGAVAARLARRGAAAPAFGFVPGFGDVGGHGDPTRPWDARRPGPPGGDRVVRGDVVEDP